ncbi:hypothetical protein KDH_00200 [Dictyobacter sp. S3.2.2.5]|uniref:Uncharacterized protein n=1 Tax=Dictyobacter halimunensis TaxID=3026934 RepID=A0ABQ6FGT6_9CHLR|nr:hypothetical protein KDH_00110 [Dictyobacter sp. S3.2.2.5]GLV53165.1 hypothetical protein KDH_00200 [Dictyobacter sp. S3.2.2.5]
MGSCGKMVVSLDPLHVSARARAVSQEGSTDWPDDDDPWKLSPFNLATKGERHNMAGCPCVSSLTKAAVWSVCGQLSRALA